MTDSRRIRVLIVDDEEDLCFLLSSMLNAQGYDCYSAHTLNAGLNAASAQLPEWIILDNDLPDGRGWESTDEFLQISPSSSVIKISANPDSERTHRQQNVHYLIKPIHVNSIVELIRSSGAIS